MAANLMEGQNDETPVVVVRDLSKSFGDIQALNGVSFDVHAGTVLGLLGPNGAGKTTLVRILTTLLDADSGSAQVAGFDVLRDKTSVRPVVGLAGQYAAIDPVMTGRENLVMVARLYHLARPEAEIRAAELLARFDLLDAADRQSDTYSGGMRRRLDLAASLVADPKVLFLDEPTTGLDPRGRMELWTMVRDLVSDGMTVLLTTQYLDEADKLADRIVVIDHGRIIAEGEIDQLKAMTGGTHLSVRVSDLSSIEPVRRLLTEEGDGPAVVDESSGEVSVPLALGAAKLADIVRRLDEADIGIADIGLRQPTLDEVFLSLTEHVASTDGSCQAIPAEES